MKTAKQLEKEAQKAAKLEKFKAKQEKQQKETPAVEKARKKEIVKPKAAVVESKYSLQRLLILKYFLFISV